MDQNANTGYFSLPACGGQAPLPGYSHSWTVLWVFLLLCCRPWALGAQVDVRAELDTTRIMIGDQVGLTLNITSATGVQVQRIDWSVLEKKDTIEIVRPGQLDTIPSSRSDLLLEQRIRLQAFEAGQYQIPPIPVYYQVEERSAAVRTNPLPLEVMTFPVESDTASLAPIKAIIEEPLKFQDILPYLVAAGVLIVAGLFIVWLIRRRRREELPAEPEVQRPAHEIAQEKLAALRAQRSWEQRDIKPFYSDLTHIVREYLENRYHIRALESTTYETIAQLQQAGLAAGWQNKLREILQTADLVKFAKARPPADKQETMLDRAEKFVETTKEVAGHQEEEAGTDAIPEKNTE